jgi:hypothetical protein
VVSDAATPPKLDRHRWSVTPPPAPLLPLNFEMDLDLPPWPHPLETVSPESPQQPALWDTGVDEDGDTTLTDVGLDCIKVCEKCALSAFCPEV